MMATRDSEYPRAMEWKPIMAELGKHMTLAKLVTVLHDRGIECGQGTLSDLASGRTEQPRYALGVALLALHKRCLKAKAPEPVDQGAK